MTFIRHITLTTGHARNSFSGEVAPEAIEALQTVIERAISNELPEPVSLAEVAPVGPYSLTGRASKKCLVVSVYHDGPPADLVCSIGVATHSRCGAALWRNLHRWGTIPVATDAENCPPEPWVAAALGESAVEHSDAMHWLGDFERCIAWAWLRYTGHS